MVSQYRAAYPEVLLSTYLYNKDRCLSVCLFVRPRYVIFFNPLPDVLGQIQAHIWNPLIMGDVMKQFAAV